MGPYHKVFPMFPGPRLVIYCTELSMHGDEANEGFPNRLICHKGAVQLRM